jgi:hypothetical protein
MVRGVVAIYVRLTQTSDVTSGKLALRDRLRLTPVRMPQLNKTQLGKADKTRTWEHRY